jgi:hypothetical protein
MAEKEHKGEKPKHNLTVTFACSGVCKTKEKHTHLGQPGSHVDLHAKGTAVTITFGGGISPFDPNVDHIDLAKDQTKTYKVGSYGTYKYNAACKACETPADDPDMIVP